MSDSLNDALAEKYKNIDIDFTFLSKILNHNQNNDFDDINNINLSFLNDVYSKDDITNSFFKPFASIYYVINSAINDDKFLNQLNPNGEYNYDLFRYTNLISNLLPAFIKKKYYEDEFALRDSILENFNNIYINDVSDLDESYYDMLLKSYFDNSSKLKNNDDEKILFVLKLITEPLSKTISANSFDINLILYQLAVNKLPLYKNNELKNYLFNQTFQTNSLFLERHVGQPFDKILDILNLNIKDINWFDSCGSKKYADLEQEEILSKRFGRTRTGNPFTKDSFYIFSTSIFTLYKLTHIVDSEFFKKNRDDIFLSYKNNIPKVNSMKKSNFNFQPNLNFYNNLKSYDVDVAYLYLQNYLLDGNRDFNFSKMLNMRSEISRLKSPDLIPPVSIDSYLNNIAKEINEHIVYNKSVFCSNLLKVIDNIAFDYNIHDEYLKKENIKNLFNYLEINSQIDDNELGEVHEFKNINSILDFVIKNNTKYNSNIDPIKDLLKISLSVYGSDFDNDIINIEIKDAIELNNKDRLDYLTSLSSVVTEYKLSIDNQQLYERKKRKF